MSGERLKSVTQIIVQDGLVDPTFFTEAGRIRGTAVHHAVFLDVDGDLQEEALHPMIAGYFKGWTKFKRDTRFSPVRELCEEPQYHPVHRYAGKPDIVGILNGRHCLIDIKSGDAKVAKIQTAAYQQFPMIKALNTTRFDLRLYADGKYRLNLHNDTNDWFIFYQALQRTRNM